MISATQQKLLVIVVVLLVLGAFGYFTFMGTSDELAPGALGNSSVPIGTVARGQNILVLVEKLKQISIDKTFFSSVLFSKLQDYSVPLQEEARGRANPFAAIGAEVSGAPSR